MNKKRIYSGISIWLAAAVLLSSCTLSMPTGQKAAANTTPSANQAAANENNVLVEGRLIPNQTTNLAFLSGGKIQELLVAEGSDVQAGAVIARLEGADPLQAAVENAKFEILSAQQDIDTLHENYAGSLANAQQQLAQAKIDLKKAQDDRTSLVYRRASDSTINGLRADLIMAQEELDKAQDYYDHHDGSDKLVVAQALSRLSAAQKARDRAQYNLNYASDLPDKNDIDKADAALSIAQARLDTARMNLDRMASGPDSKALALAEGRLQKAQSDLKASQSNLENLNLRAPFGGRIVNLNATQGAMVNPGQVIATLADFSSWIVETNDLTELKVVQLQVGQKAALIADALPNETLAGTIERISNGYVEKQGDITYTVRVRLDQTDPRLRWGMTIAVQFDASTTIQVPNQPQSQTSPVPTLVAQTALAATPDPAAAMPNPATSAESAIQSYFTALENQDPQSAVALISNFSLSAERTTRERAISALQTQFAQGTRWSGLTVKESRNQDANTVLVHVLYTLATQDAATGAKTQLQKDEWWPARLENGQWLFNWNQVIDFRGLDIPGQTTAGLTISPIQINRYADHFRVVLFVQNRTNESIVLGQPNENLAVFTFGDQTAEAEKAQFVFERMHTYPDISIEVKGSFSQYPDKIEIRKWKNYQVAPWYTFALPGTKE